VQGWPLHLRSVIAMWLLAGNSLTPVQIGDLALNDWQSPRIEDSPDGPSCQWFEKVGAESRSQGALVPVPGRGISVTSVYDPMRTCLRTQMPAGSTTPGTLLLQCLRDDFHSRHQLFILLGPCNHLEVARSAVHCLGIIFMSLAGHFGLQILRHLQSGVLESGASTALSALRYGMTHAGYCSSVSRSQFCWSILDKAHRKEIPHGRVRWHSEGVVWYRCLV
jgi:hypothetical protein